MKVFVTGGTGFIGSHVLNKLNGLDFSDIYVLSRGKKSDSGKITYIKGDISRPETFQEYISRCDYVIHMAGCLKDKNYFESVNVDGTNNIINACKKNYRLKKIIHISSAGVIGKTDKLIIDELTPCNPLNTYEKTKYKAELIIKDFLKNNPGKAVILRPTNVYGENDPESHLLNLISKIMKHRFFFIGNEEANYYLNYLYVKEISELVPRLLYTETKNDTYILNTPTRLPEFITKIKNIIHDDTTIKRLPYWPMKMIARCFDKIPNEIMRHHPINTKKFEELTNMKRYSSNLLAKDLNWAPIYALDEALNNLVCYYGQKELLT